VPHAHLFGGEQAPGSQSAVAALQFEGLADVGNLFQVEPLILPSPSSLPVQNFRDLTITVMIQERIDLSDYLRLCLPNLSDWQGFLQGQTSSSAAAETHMNLDQLAIDQGDIFDEQAENALSFARFDGWIIPYSWKVGSQRKQLLPGL